MNARDDFEQFGRMRRVFDWLVEEVAPRFEDHPVYGPVLTFVDRHGFEEYDDENPVPEEVAEVLRAAKKVMSARDVVKALTPPEPLPNDLQMMAELGEAFLADMTRALIPVIEKSLDRIDKELES